MSPPRPLIVAILLLTPAACTPVDEPEPRASENVAAGSFVNPSNPALPGAVPKSNAKTELPETPTTAKQSDESQAAIPARLIEPSIAAAVRLAQAGKLPEALELVNRVLASESDNRDALFLHAQLAQSSAQKSGRPASNPLYHASVASLEQLQKLYKNLTPNERQFASLAYYNEACTYAVEKKPELAVKDLRRALENGFGEFELIGADPELASLHDRDDFKKLAGEVDVIERKQARTLAELGLAANKPFPFHFSLAGLDGKPVKLGDFRGKVVVVDFWGTWCPPCRKELPHLASIYEKYRDKGLAMIGLNYENGDEKDAQAAVESFLKVNKVPYPCLLGDKPTRAQVPEFNGFPTTLFLDRAGVVRLRLIGYHDQAELEAVVEMLLAEPDHAGDSAALPKTN